MKTNIVVTLIVCLGILLSTGAGIICNYQSANQALVYKPIPTALKEGENQPEKFLIASLSPSAITLNIVGNFFYSLAISLFISVFVTYNLQRHRQQDSERQLQEIQKSINIDVFNSLFKRIVPDEIFSAIKSQIIKAKIIRKNARWIYEFVECGENYELNSTFIFSLDNLSGEPVTLPYQTRLDKSDGLKSNLESVDCVCGKTHIIKHRRGTHPAPEVKEHTTPDGIKTISYTVTVPPKESASLTLRYKYEIDKPSHHWTTKYPLIDGSLMVKMPDNHTLTLDDSNMATGFSLKSDTPNQMLYELTGGVLPGQGFTIYLNKSDPATQVG